MEQFITMHQKNVIGVLEGFDRVLFRGTFPSLAYGDGMGRFLSAKGIRLTQFKEFALRCSRSLAEHARQMAADQGRPYLHLSSPKISKEEQARQIAERDAVNKGLICVFSCVEPCRSFSLRRDEKGLPHLVSETRKCNFFYFYVMDREFGLMHVRLQSWLPFDIQVCINGRSYLARQLDREGIGYVRKGNGFLRIDNLPRAQEILNRLHRRNWSSTLNALAQWVNPHLNDPQTLDARSYYWTLRQSELATDVMFDQPQSLEMIYPSLCRHIMERHCGQDVLRFFGKKADLRFNGEVLTEQQRLVEGVRVRHRFAANSIKMYDKAGSILRVETTINNPQPFQVLRKAQNDPASALAWRPMRKGIADIRRRVEVSLNANRRYLDALSVVGHPSPTHWVLDPVCHPVKRHGKRSRALRPIAPDEGRLFAAVLHGGHLIHGFSNRNLQALLYATAPKNRLERRRRCNRISRLLRLLRGHGLIQKLGRRRLYRVTKKGYHVMTLSLALREAQTNNIQAA
jgi:hypothetical protein